MILNKLHAGNLTSIFKESLYKIGYTWKIWKLYTPKWEYVSKELSKFVDVNTSNVSEEHKTDELVSTIGFQVFLSAFLADVCGYYTPFIQVHSLLYSQNVIMLFLFQHVLGYWNKKNDVKVGEIHFNCFQNTKTNASIVLIEGKGWQMIIQGDFFLVTGTPLKS